MVERMVRTIPNGKRLSTTTSTCARVCEEKR